MKKLITLITALLLFCTAHPASSAAASSPERMYFKKANVTLVVMMATSDCCDYVGATEATGWKSTPSKTKHRYTCYLTIGEVDVALACYQGQNPGRIGTEVTNTHPEENSCPTDIVSQLVGPGVDNIIRDFEQNGYPDECNADGCGDGGLSSGGDGEAPSE